MSNMSWYVLSLLAILCWSGSDLFSKMASRHEDSNSQYKIMVVLGFTMGLHAVWLLLHGAGAGFADFITYLPAGICYILSMILGYIGLRYMVLSVSSPICNSSGAVEMLLCFLILGQTANLPQILCALLLVGSVIALAIVESRRPAQAFEDGKPVHYTRKEVLWGLLLPVAYCIIDSLGTVYEGYIYDAELMLEDTGTVVYELMWLVIAILSLLYLVFVKKESFFKWTNKKELVAQSVCETAGNYFYIYAISANAILAEPAIGCYAVVSVLWGRLLLKEKLTLKHYLCVGVCLLGIALLGVFSEL